MRKIFWLSTVLSTLALGASAAVPSGGYLGLYCETYDACRSEFLETARRAASSTEGKVWSERLPSRASDDLTVDFAFFPSAVSANGKLLLLTSGIHGLEGFTGSTLQTFFITSGQLAETLHKGVSVLMVHGLNAYGFKYGSRYTESRVDLNRNWFVDEKFPAAQQDQIYDRFSTFFNPQKRATYGNADFAWWTSRHLLPWVKSAMNGKLTQAAGQGQYRYPRGIEFGGRSYEPQRAIFLANVGPYLARFSHVMHFDLHTGLGRREMQLLPNAPHSNEIAQLRHEIFEKNGYGIEQTGSATFYSSFGDFSDFVCDEVAAKYAGHHCVNMLLEYGTLLQTYWSEWPKVMRLYKENVEQAFTLYITVRENQLYYFGARSTKEAAKLRADYRSLFYPADTAWRVMVLSETLTSWPKFITSFAGL